MGCRMPPEQIKEALQGEWLLHLNKHDDCKLANEIEPMCIPLLLWISMNMFHNLAHIMVACCNLGYEFRKREYELQELERMAGK